VENAPDLAAAVAGLIVGGALRTEMPPDQ